MKYLYLCECDDDGKYDDIRVTKLKPTTITKDKRCHGCGHYAFRMLESEYLRQSDKYHKLIPKVEDYEDWMNG